MTGAGTRLSLTAEAAAAQQILASAGIAVSTNFPEQPLPRVPDEVLAPVLREAVTNILRHSMASACTIDVTACGDVLRLRISNDGAGEHAGRTPAAGAGGGHGLPNLTARVHAAGGLLAASAADGRFDLTAQIPLDGTGPRPAAGPESQPGMTLALSG